MVKTRFAPSPTGFLHLGGARTALFSYAYAKKNNGQFILRIEDTDIERSTQASVDSIIDAMNWLGLTYDEGPYYQTKRMDRYKEVIQLLLDKGLAYYCYCTKEELDLMREEQKSKNIKPKYNRKCLSLNADNMNLPKVVRFKNPTSGSVKWDDLVKGTIEINNEELDDLIIARSDGTPTYNFCVVVDDLDMGITHVVRGDDHVNNTPRQINLLKALDAEIPKYAHVPMILREDGNKMSKRLDAVSVTQYKEMGILPEALLNYLARLCFGHGNDEIFDLNQFIEWFDLNHISPSPARFDIKKLLWVNSEHIKRTESIKLVPIVSELISKNNDNLLNMINNSTLNFELIINLLKNRSDNLVNLAKEVEYFYVPYSINEEDRLKHITPDAKNILSNFLMDIKEIENSWTIDSIKGFIKQFCLKYNVKMPQLGMPLRLALCGTTHTPSFDSIVEILGYKTLNARINKFLEIN